jgi:hypothetical protein
MKRTGRVPSGHALWTDQEDKIVRSFPRDYKVLCPILKGRTLSAIKNRTSLFGLGKKPHYWTGSDVSTLRKLYRYSPKAELMTAFPGVSWTAICGKAEKLQFARKRRRPQSVDNPVLDAIRDRAFQYNWSLRNLDEFAGTKGYFRYLRDCNCIPKKRYILKAIKALDGHLSVNADGCTVLSWDNGPKHRIRDYDKHCSDNIERQKMRRRFRTMKEERARLKFRSAKRYRISPAAINSSSS